MSKSIITTQRGGSGSPWRIIPKEAQIGEICTVTTGTDDVVFGDVVYATADQTSTDIGGEDSYMLTVTRTTATPTDAQIGAGFVAVCQQVDGVDATKKGAFEFGPATLQVNVYLAAAANLDAGTALVTGDAAASAGMLVVPAGGGNKPHKVVGHLARSYAAADLATGVNLVWVHFDGIYGFGSVDTHA